jgi:hypothetical protein
LLLLLFVALPWLPEVAWVRTAAIVAVVLGLGFAVCVVALTVYGERPLHVLLKPFARLRFLHAERLEQAAVNLSAGLMGLRRAHLGGASFISPRLVAPLRASFWLVSSASTSGRCSGPGFSSIATGFARARRAGRPPAFEAATSSPPPPTTSPSRRRCRTRSSFTPSRSRRSWSRALSC